MTVLFKLTKENGLTRRITFSIRPTWPLLSGKIASLYNIAVENVAISYIDSDGDDVTLSSDEELQDFYSSLSTDDSAIKLAVHDLSSIRTTNPLTQSLPSATPQQLHFRNTFGGHEVLPRVFDAEDEWQRLPGSLFLSRDAPESPHAFVEVLDSDVSLSKSDAESRDDTVHRSDLTFSQTTSQNKGKGKGRAATVEDDVSSAGSIIGDEAPAKPPVHVFDVSSDDMHGHSPRSTVNLRRSGIATPAQAQSTPVITEQPLKANVSINGGEQKTGAVDDDPPLPYIDLSDPDRTPPSLAHDIATLLTTISTVISTHPELSERLRNIVVNATNGTYWAAHRDAISSAAENIHRTAIQEAGKSLEELRRATEQEAGTRVTEALGRIFRTVGEFAHDGRENASLRASRDASQVPLRETTPGAPRLQSGVVPTPSLFPHFPRLAPFLGGIGRPQIPPPPPFTSQVPPGETSPEALWPPSGVAPTPPLFPHLPPSDRESFLGGIGLPPISPPPPPPPPFSPFTPRSWPRPPPHRFWRRDPEYPGSTLYSCGAKAAAAEARPAEERADSTATQPSSTLEVTAEELRADVERAKADYKIRKEKYRQAKAIKKMAEQRRREQESTTESLSRQTSDNPAQATPEQGPTVIAATPTPERHTTEPISPTSEVHIVSNARGPYPQLEMFSVPRRSHTTNYMARGHVQENRPLNRIMRKLSDMGFTESTYPNLTRKVMDQLLSHPPVTKDAEDDVVTNLIEELVSSGGATNASGSGGIPGAWN